HLLAAERRAAAQARAVVDRALLQRRDVGRRRERARDDVPARLREVTHHRGQEHRRLDQQRLEGSNDRVGKRLLLRRQIAQAGQQIVDGAVEVEQRLGRERRVAAGGRRLAVCVVTCATQRRDG